MANPISKGKGFTNLVGFHFFHILKTAGMYHGVFLCSTKIVAKKLKTRNLLAMFPNITIENYDFRVAHTVFIFSGVVRILMIKSFFFFVI